jgi:hypothetical protein
MTAAGVIIAAVIGSDRPFLLVRVLFGLISAMDAFPAILCRYE